MNELKRFWNFLWNDDSLLSWIVFIIIVFVLIKFILFPFMGLVTGTSLPLAIVESCSMYHGQNFDDWWKERGGWYGENGISKTEFEEFPLKNGFNKGDIFLVLGADKKDLEIGDTIIFSGGSSGRPIIHRVVNLDPLQTKGDHNSVQFTGSNNAEKIDETDIQESQIIGRATVIRVPLAGWVKLIFYEPFRPKGERGFCSK